MHSRATAQEFGQLRARLEATFSGPSLVVVTSASRGDGKTATAFGLAQALANAEHRVLLVDANTENPTLARVHRMPNLDGRVDVSKVSRHATRVAGEEFEGISFADERVQFGMSLDKIKAAAFDMRSHFDFVVVDTAQVLHSDLAVLFATVADGTLLTVRLGRLPVTADSETMKTLTRVGANVIGLLTVTQSIIRAFAVQREEVIKTVRVPARVPARHITSHHSTAPESTLEIVERTRSQSVS